jgi:hypothetical protein
MLLATRAPILWCPDVAIVVRTAQVGDVEELGMYMNGVILHSYEYSS